MSKRNNKETTRLVKTKKRKIRKRVYFIILPIVIAFLAVLSYASYLYIKADSVLTDSYEDDGREKSDLRETIVDPTEDNVSVLIMGVDASNVRNNAESSRTDTLMVATLNKIDNSVKLVSIPRDSLVYIPEVGYETKINHAHAYGGTKATIDTVENLLEIPIDYYVKLNFEAFIDVVDAIGGINVEVPYELYEQNSKDKARAIHLLPGEQELDGEEALALARTRKLDNDIERGKRQQEIIKAVVQKSVSVNSILNMDDVIEAVGSNMTTNMTFSEMKSFVSYGTSGKNLDFQTITLEGTDYQPSGTYYWKLDEMVLGETKQALQEHLDLIETTTASQPTETTSEEITY
ncbi:LCP family protein [Oceanobacillus halophilus]|uniref:LytR family transcriptional regulator n=1 Tax=Oceanobacillus halophilus TaxID=930130 RepID=A0A495A3X4_9BACI|nr:LCP family protein [Oceanobacillus halophilus]RKQ34305.1 LytR family transcriptional regulator [Oceanobacillus halophilus]